MSEEQVIVPLGCAADAVPPVTHVRGTLLSGSLRALSSTDQRARYDELLDPAYRDAIMNLIVATWVPVDVAMAHYRAMDAIGYSPAQQVENGRLVANRIQNTYVGTIIRGLRASGGVSVWAVLERFGVAYGRLMQGGGHALHKLGPKDARVEIYGNPLASIPYFRAGWEGMFESTLQLVTRRVYTKQVRAFQAEDRVAFQISWV